MSYIDHASPQEAYHTLKTQPDACMIDVRSEEEWAMNGIPDLSETPSNLILVEWRQKPEGFINPAFEETCKSQIDLENISKIFFICHAGVRSLEAAEFLSARLDDTSNAPAFINVQEGFEGYASPYAHDAPKSGWKAANLPWRKSDTHER